MLNVFIGKSSHQDQANRLSVLTASSAAVVVESFGLIWGSKRVSRAQMRKLYSLSDAPKRLTPYLNRTGRYKSCWARYSDSDYVSSSQIVPFLHVGAPKGLC